MSPAAPLARVVLAVVMALPAAGCGSVVQETGSEGGAPGLDPTPVACDGALGTAPVVLAEGVEARTLVVTGDLVVLAGDTGRVTAVDRCTGDTRVVAELGAPTELAVIGAEVFAAVGASALGDARLVHIPLTAGEATLVTALPGPGRLAAHDGRLFAVVDLPIDEGDADDLPDDGVPDAGVLEIDPASGETTLLHREDLWLPGGWSLVGAGAAGLYVVNSSFHGGNPGLLRVPLDAPDDVAEVPGTHGAHDVAVVGDHILVGGEAEENGMGSGIVDIARLPLAGDAREVLLAADDDTSYVQHIAARPGVVCWALLSGGTVRCMADEAGAAVRRIGEDAEGFDPVHNLALTGDAVVWLHGRDRDGDGVVDAGVDLLAAAL